MNNGRRSGHWSISLRSVFSNGRCLVAIVGGPISVRTFQFVPTESSARGHATICQAQPRDKPQETLLHSLLDGIRCQAFRTRAKGARAVAILSTASCPIAGSYSRPRCGDARYGHDGQCVIVMRYI